MVEAIEPVLNNHKTRVKVLELKRRLEEISLEDDRAIDLITNYFNLRLTAYEIVHYRLLEFIEPFTLWLTKVTEAANRLKYLWNEILEIEERLIRGLMEIAQDLIEENEKDEREYQRRLQEEEEEEEEEEEAEENERGDNGRRRNGGRRNLRRSNERRDSESEDDGIDSSSEFYWDRYVIVNSSDSDSDFVDSEYI